MSEQNKERFESRFKVIEDQGDAHYVECKHCGTKFWSDATGDNCIVRNGGLYTQCPKCLWHSAPPYTKEEALNEAWTVLVRLAGANRDDREDFVRGNMEPQEHYEWRFQGIFGRGGKFRIRALNRPGRFFVSMYQEDETPRLVKKLELVNRELGLIEFTE